MIRCNRLLAVVMRPTPPLLGQRCNGFPKRPVSTQFFARHDCFSSSSSGGSHSPPPTNQPKDPDRPSEFVLNRVASILRSDLPLLFFRPCDQSILDRDIVLDDRIRGKKIVGGIHYVHQISLLKMIGHIKFVNVVLRLRSLDVCLDEGSVEVRWAVHGLGLLNLVVNYFPKKLYRRANMENYMPLWKEGVSTYFVNTDGKIFLHVLDDKREDKERKMKIPNTVEKIRQGMKKLGEEPSPAPAMYKK